MIQNILKRRNAKTTRSKNCDRIGNSPFRRTAFGFRSALANCIIIIHVQHMCPGDDMHSRIFYPRCVYVCVCVGRYIVSNFPGFPGADGSLRFCEIAPRRILGWVNLDLKVAFFLLVSELRIYFGARSDFSSKWKLKIMQFSIHSVWNFLYNFLYVCIVFIDEILMYNIIKLISILF